jgi:hypothetical protein
LRLPLRLGAELLMPEGVRVRSGAACAGGVRNQAR